jgi:hypothetical protein
MKIIEYKIITPSKLAIYYNQKTIIISGEVTLTPIFYANIDDFNYWKPPFEKERISEEEKKEIIDFITKDSCKEGKTKIVFD